MKDRPRIAVVGHVTEDVFDDKIEAGGCATYASSVLHRLGGDVELHTSCAPDWLHPVSCPRLRVQRTDSSVTSRFRNEFRPDGTRSQVLLHQASELEIPETTGLDWLHIVPVLDEVELDPWIPRLVRARETSTRVSVGLQGFTRRACGTPPAEIEFVEFDTEARWLDCVDMIFASEEDFFGQPGLLDELIARVPRVVLTRAEHGARVYTYRRLVCEIGIFETNAQDPTGAGDTFAAGVVGSLALGRTLESSLRCAAALASLAIESQGLSGVLRDIDLEARERSIDVA